MIHGTYTGPKTSLQGFTALLQSDEQGNWFAQFDDIKAFGAVHGSTDSEGNYWRVDGIQGKPKHPEGVLCYGWHKFAIEDFSFDEKTELANEI